MSGGVDPACECGCSLGATCAPLSFANRGRRRISSRRSSRSRRVGCINSVFGSGRVRGPYSRALVPLISRSCSCSCRSGIWRSAACSSSSCFVLVNRVQGARDRRAAASASGTSSAGRPSAADEDRSCLSRCCESVAAIALAVVHGYADDAAALAPATRRPPLDLRRSKRVGFENSVRAVAEAVGG